VEYRRSGEGEKAMSEQNFTAPTYPLYRLSTLPFEDGEAKEIMVKHGCRFEEHPDEWIVFFPEGTTKTEIYPRTMQSRYRIVFPDGYELREIYDRFREVSLLAYSLE
jgi:hypothetical protein